MNNAGSGCSRRWVSTGLAGLSATCGAGALGVGCQLDWQVFPLPALSAPRVQHSSNSRSRQRARLFLIIAAIGLAVSDLWQTLKRMSERESAGSRLTRAPECNTPRTKKVAQAVNSTLDSLGKTEIRHLVNRRESAEKQLDHLDRPHRVRQAVRIKTMQMPAKSTATTELESRQRLGN